MRNDGLRLGPVAASPPADPPISKQRRHPVTIVYNQLITDHWAGPQLHSYHLMTAGGSRNETRLGSRVFVESGPGRPLTLTRHYSSHSATRQRTVDSRESLCHVGLRALYLCCVSVTVPRQGRAYRTLFSRINTGSLTILFYETSLSH